MFKGLKDPLEYVLLPNSQNEMDKSVIEKNPVKVTEHLETIYVKTEGFVEFEHHVGAVLHYY